MILRTNADIDHAFSILSQAENLGCDTETSGLNPRNSRLFSVQFSDGNFSCLIPTSEGVPLDKLSEILENQQITKIFHNAKFDLGFLRENGYEVNGFYCTMIAEKLLTKGASQSASLAETLYRYFAVDLDKSQRDKFTKNWNKIWTEELVEYALADVIYLPELKRLQEEWLVKLGLSEELGLKLDLIY
jgi:DNA polymerase I